VVPTFERCPLCQDRAVSVVRDAELDGIRVEVTIRCGACGTWRRVVVTVWAFEGHQRRLEWDREEMASALARFDPAHLLR
jgi:hypothetical protein